MSLFDIYSKRHERILVPIAETLRLHLNAICEPLQRVDRVAVRAKSPKSFVDKAAKKKGDGMPKYPEPIFEIQDQIGARVVVFYQSDVVVVEKLVERYFRKIEREFKEPDSHWKFGYFGLHFTLVLPKDVIPREIDPADAPEFFELQIKTLFEHAWSEAEHDLGYKTVDELPIDHQRRLAFTSAQAWGADQEFDRLHRELQPQ